MEYEIDLFPTLYLLIYLFTYFLASASKDVQEFIDLCNDYIKCSFKVGLIEVPGRMLSDSYGWYQTDFSSIRFVGVPIFPIGIVLKAME